MDSMNTPTLVSNPSITQTVIDSLKPRKFSNVSLTLNSPKPNKTFIAKLKSLLLKLISYISNLENWQKSPKLWIWAFIFLRCAYVFLKEWGFLGKKKLDGDHVFLTGAGNGIGRLMAIRFGKLGCYLSLSDVNMQGLEETKQMCIAEGISADKIHTMHCDVASRDSIA